MQTLCDEHRAPACKSCKGHRGVRHCCSRHHKGHPRVLGGGQRCLLVQRGGEGGATALSGRVALQRVGARASPRDQGGGGGGGQAGHATADSLGAAHRAQVRGTGGPPRRAHSHRTASFRRAATYRGARQLRNRMAICDLIVVDHNGAMALCRFIYTEYGFAVSTLHDGGNYVHYREVATTLWEQPRLGQTSNVRPPCRTWGGCQAV